ncbi:12191_t:CDS:2 [Cetraspora pellucida]|uniref:12191_t:CDS:1 n=1 Tax=Cetraspora pellucida TaxID=1433469 RepID=A0A9N9GU72_9GLOM|nr:12191_t:CDS:2 [Cetraspora pellucida]
MSTNDSTTPKTSNPEASKDNDYADIYLNCLITLCLPYHFFKIKVSNGSDVESLETQVQAHLSLLPSDATSTPRHNNPDQNTIHVLVEQLPGSETQII